MSNIDKKEYKLEPDSELRFEIISKNKSVNLELKEGLAELFGAELEPGKKYEFLPGTSVAINTWQGCTLELEGSPDISYICKETPAVIYLNCHVVLERLRKLAEKENEKGPVVMVVGPGDVGKSTLCRLLVNYALRMNRNPLYVNLDVGQTEFGVPGTVGVILTNEPASIEKQFTEEAPLAFHFGYSSPQCNEKLYRVLIDRIVEVCDEIIKKNSSEKHSGIIINTCGWINGQGYNVLNYIAQAFEVDAIFVIDHEKLYNDLTADLPKFVKIVLLPKSSGVLRRNETQRAKARNSIIRRYFYGIPKSPVQTFKIDLKFDDISIYRITSLSNYSPNMPARKSDKNCTNLVPLIPIPNMKNHMLSVSFAKVKEHDVAQTNVVGFLHIQEVNMLKKILTVLSTQLELTKDVILLLSEVKFYDDG